MSDFMYDNFGKIILSIFALMALLFYISDRQFEERNAELMQECLKAGNKQWDCTVFIENRKSGRANNTAIMGAGAAVGAGMAVGKGG